MKPFVSILILAAFGLVSVILKMEVVRTSYEVLRLGRIVKNAANEKSALELTYARLTRPERLDLIATRKLALNRAQKNQVVLMAANGTWAVRQ